MTFIKINHLTFQYDTSYDLIFDDVSFLLDSDWKLGLIGRNGRGKTTLLKILEGKLDYQGTIDTKVSFEYFPYYVQDENRLTIDIIEDVLGEVELWKIQKELSLLGVEDCLYQLFSTLSYGQKTKVLIASLFVKENAFLLIDEPTNHLDCDGRSQLCEYLNRKKGFILVSHDRTFLDHCIDHVMSINKSDIDIKAGNFSSWYQDKTYQDLLEMNRNQKLKKEIKRLEKSARQKENWSNQIEKSKRGAYDKGFVGHKAAKMMKRAKNVERQKEKMIEERKGLLKNVDETAPLTLNPLSMNKTLISFHHVSLFYGEKKIISDLSFTIQNQDRICLQGINGCGKSTIIKLIVNKNIKYTGDIYFAPHLKISYINQDASQLKGYLDDFIRENSLDPSLYKAILRKLGLTRNMFEKKIDEYSLGQKKKLLLAQSILTPAHLYIYDEPLNYIDIMTRMQIEDIILTSKPTLLFVEHDEKFIENVATKIISLSSNKL